MRSDDDAGGWMDVTVRGWRSGRGVWPHGSHRDKCWSRARSHSITEHRPRHKLPSASLVTHVIRACARPVMQQEMLDRGWNGRMLGVFVH